MSLLRVAMILTDQPEMPEAPNTRAVYPLFAMFQRSLLNDSVWIDVERRESSHLKERGDIVP